MARKRITCCPHCGSALGVYTLVDYLQVREDYCFSGEALAKSTDNPHRAEKRRESKTVYCRKCNQPIAHTRLMRKQWGEGVFRLADIKEAI